VKTLLQAQPGPATILKACAKGGPARPGSEAARPARNSLQASRQETLPGRQEKACRSGLKPGGPARPSFKNRR